MRHLFDFEHRRLPIASSAHFASRLRRSGRWAAGIIIAALVIGMAGYMYFEGMGLTDAFVNAAMIISGMGPLGPLVTTGGKIFAGLYAIACGLLIIGVAGLVLAPVFHRILHRFHVEDDRADR